MIESFRKGLEKIVEKGKEYEVGLLGAEMAAAFAGPELIACIEVLKHVNLYSDHYKLNAIIKGLAEENNVETKMNELYSFVSKSKEHAFVVSEYFRKAMLSSSPIVCCIMGILLAKLAGENRKPTQEEAIIMRAISSFTDYDIQYFYEIMTSDCIIENEYGKRYIDTSMLPLAEYEMTLDICKSSRIFASGSVSNDAGVLIMDVAIVDDIADELMDYVFRAKRQMEYESNS